MSGDDSGVSFAPWMSEVRAAASSLLHPSQPSSCSTAACWASASSACEVLEELEQRGDLRAFLPVLVGDSGPGEQPTNGEPLGHGRRLVLLVQRDLADLGRRELLRPAEVLAVLCRPDVAGGKQR